MLKKTKSHNWKIRRSAAPNIQAACDSRKRKSQRVSERTLWHTEHRGLPTREYLDDDVNGS